MNEELTFKEFVTGVIGAVVLIIIIILLWRSFYTISAGNRGILFKFGKVQDEIVGEGLHFKNPLYSVEKIDTKTQTINFNEKENGILTSASKDLQDVSIEASVNYHKDQQKVNLIFQQFGKNYDDNVIMPIIKEVVKSTSAKYTAEELVTKRAEFSEEVNRVLTERFSEKYAILERFNLVNFNFSKSFNEAIEAKVTAEQNALASKNKLEQVKFEAQQEIEKANGKAEAMRIEAQALKENQQIMELKSIEKWDGHLPTYITSGSQMPFIEIK